MKRVILSLAFVCAAMVVLANQVIVSSCGTSVYIPDDVSVEEALEIYDALEALCP